MLQETGRVCEAPYRYSYVLRFSLFFCAADTFMMVLKFIWLLAVGCSFKTTARHVWYDRFKKELPMDEVWNGGQGKYAPTSTTIPYVSNSSDPDTAMGISTGSDDVYVCSGALPVEGQAHNPSYCTTNIPLEAVTPSTIRTSTEDTDLYICSGALPVEAEVKAQADHMTSPRPKRIMHLDASSDSNQPISTVTTLPDPEVNSEEQGLTNTIPTGTRIFQVERADVLEADLITDPDAPSQHYQHISAATPLLGMDPEELDIRDALLTELNASPTGEYCDLEAGLEEAFVEHASATKLAKYYSRSGSEADRAWRLSMATFLIGALPQAVKVFGMKGVPITQMAVAILLATFCVPEIFRTFIQCLLCLKPRKIKPAL
ncbi:hypothetical protein M011DRAFT_20376 [Sporormia fimetaria CBS 119925]|uniref:Uncharacterized protein n=1 Tax=Sporormia fimetaria CBS 119925 TaxID=1340428 RepID=A0A6A6VSL8_9PLEO|nr:hypothetical protein M011DRAFT_20376 [Sporormia fimetaria CBS 119925]